jgi:hypothetical protein
MWCHSYTLLSKHLDRFVTDGTAKRLKILKAVYRRPIHKGAERQRGEAFRTGKGLGGGGGGDQ